MNLPVRRTRENAVLTGVCAGLARRWGVDANLLRIALIILSFASGLGLVLYGVGYLVLPADEATPAPARRLLPFTKDWPLPALVVTLTAVGFIGFGMLGGWSGVGLLPVLVALGIWYSVSRKRGQRVTHADPTPFERAAEAWRLRLVEHQSSSGALALPTPAAASFAPAVPPSAVPSEVVRRTKLRNNRLWWLALGLMLVGCTTVAAFTPHGGGYHIAGLDYLAVILISLGLTLLVGTWLGRPRLMGLITVLVMIATGITWVAQSPLTSGVVGVGDQSHVFTSTDDLPETISLTAGDLNLDFTQLALTADAAIQVGLGAGDLTVRLPEKVNAQLIWSVGVGEASLPGTEKHSGASLSGTLTHNAPADAPTIVITVNQGAGNLEVRS